MTEYKLDYPLVDVSDKTNPAVEDLKQQAEIFGFVPNMYAGMAEEPMLLKSYLESYTLFRKLSTFERPEQEVIFLAVSLANGCKYCMAAHSFVADNLTHVPTEVTDAIRNRETIPDPKLKTLFDFTTTMFNTRGKPTKADVDAFVSAGFKEKQILQIIVVLAVKTLSNYFNHIYDTPLDDTFAGRKWS